VRTPGYSTRERRRRCIAGSASDTHAREQGHQLEEQVGGFGFEWDVADLVNNEQGVAAQPDQFLLKTPAMVGLGQPCHPLAGGGE
jgi:hypothetical protein